MNPGAILFCFPPKRVTPTHVLAEDPARVVREKRGPQFRLKGIRGLPRTLLEHTEVE